MGSPNYHAVHADSHSFSRMSAARKTTPVTSGNAFWSFGTGEKIVDYVKAPK